MVVLWSLSMEEEVSRSEPVVLSGEEKLRLCLVCGLGERGPGDYCKHQKIKWKGEREKEKEGRERKEGREGIGREGIGRG